MFRSGARAIGGMRFQGLGGGGYNWRLLLPGSQYDYEAAAGDLWRNSAVACCLRWIRVNYPEPVLEVVRKLPDGKDEVVTNSEVVKLLHRPNPFYDRWTFSAACVLSYVVDGNCYVRKIRSASGKVVQLWWVPHWLIFPRWRMDGTEFIGWYDYEVNGYRERIEIDDIIHWKCGTDPRDDRKGFSEVKSTLRSICGLNECDTYTAAILRNMGIVGAVISISDKDISISPGEIDVMRDQWREEYTSEGRGAPLFAPRPMTVQRLGMSPEEMRLDKIPNRLEGQIHAAVGLSPMVTNSAAGADHKTFANYGEARKAAYEDCLIPLQGSLAECLTWELLLKDFTEGDQVKWNYEGIKCLAENETETAERVGKAYQVYQGITRAEYREALGYDWTDEDEVYFAEAAGGSEVDPENDDDEDGEGIGVERSHRWTADGPVVTEAAVLRRADRVLRKLEASQRKQGHVPSGPHGGEFTGGKTGGTGGKTGDAGGKTGGAVAAGGTPQQHNPTAKAAADRVKKGKPVEYKSEKAVKAAGSAAVTDKSVQEYTKKNEYTVAKHLGGKADADNKAVDVEIKHKEDGKIHGVEVKTLVQGKNDKVTMHKTPKPGELKSAIDRKVDFQNAHGTTVHTVIDDHRARFKGGENKHLYSGNDLYYKRGTGSFNLSSMHPVKDWKEMKVLMRTPYDKLPKKAQGDRRGGLT